MLHQDYLKVEKAIIEAKQRIGESFEKHHGPFEGWGDDIQKRYSESVHPLTETLKTLRNLYFTDKAA